MSGSTVGIKIADGSYYPILEQGFTGRKKLTLTTVADSQTRVQIDLYRGSENQADTFLGSLTIDNAAGGDTFVFTTSDDRFEISDGKLRLKDGLFVVHDPALTVVLDVTAVSTLDARIRVREGFAIEVGENPFPWHNRPRPEDIDGFDLVGFGSGINGFDFHPGMKSFASSLP